MLIMHVDGNGASEDLVDCDGASAQVVGALTCSVPIATLKAAPFSLVYDSEVLVKIVAINEIGSSVESE